MCFEEQLAGTNRWTYVGNITKVKTSGGYLVTPGKDQPTTYTFNDYGRKNVRVAHSVYDPAHPRYLYKVVKCLSKEESDAAAAAALRAKVMEPNNSSAAAHAAAARATAARNVGAMENKLSAAAAGAAAANRRNEANRNVGAMENEWGAAAAGVAAANRSNEANADAARVAANIPNLANIPSPAVNIGNFGRAFEEGRAAKNAKKQSAKNAKNGNSRTRKSRRPRAYKSRRSTRR